MYHKKKREILGEPSRMDQKISFNGWRHDQKLSEHH